MHDILILWSIIYANISYLALGFSTVHTKWLCKKNTVINVQQILYYRTVVN